MQLHQAFSCNLQHNAVARQIYGCNIHFNDNDDNNNDDDNDNILNYPLPDRGNLSCNLFRNKNYFVRRRKRKLGAYFSQCCDFFRCTVLKFGAVPLRKSFALVTSIFNDSSVQFSFSSVDNNDYDNNYDNDNILNYPLPDRGNLSRIDIAP